MRLALPLLLIALPAACGPAPVEENVGPNTAEIKAVSTPANDVEPASMASIDLQPLSAADLAEVRDGCRFARNGATLVAASGSLAIARVEGALRHFVPTSPPDETGAFLEDRQLSISIGRTEPGTVTARITVTNRRSEAQQRWAGSWVCAA